METIKDVCPRRTRSSSALKEEVCVRQRRDGLEVEGKGSPGDQGEL